MEMTYQLTLYSQAAVNIVDMTYGNKGEVLLLSKAIAKLAGMYNQAKQQQIDAYLRLHRATEQIADIRQRFNHQQQRYQILIKEKVKSPEDTGSIRPVRVITLSVGNELIKSFAHVLAEFDSIMITLQQAKHHAVFTKPTAYFKIKKRLNTAYIKLLYTLINHLARQLTPCQFVDYFNQNQRYHKAVENLPFDVETLYQAILLPTTPRVTNDVINRFKQHCSVLIPA